MTLIATASTLEKNPLNIWLATWSFAVSLAWLLPNHYNPWPTFHSDAWMAVMMLMPAGSIVFHRGAKIDIHPITLAALALLPIPMIQFSTGLVLFSGQAWVVSLYIAGFALSVALGAYWERTSLNQLTDAIFASFLCASIVSVGLQLQQWFVLDGLEMWTAGYRGSRPYANLNQPNQLATLLIWGVLAVMWFYTKKVLSARPAVFISLYLIFGIVLTQSRTAWLGICFIVAVLWLKNSLWVSKAVAWTASCLLLFLAAASIFLQPLTDALTPGSAMRGLDTTTGYLRIAAYRLGWDALLQHPWRGYGWNQIEVAQLTVAKNHPSLGAFFTYSHNLILDFMLWCGIPVGLAVGCFVIYMMYTSFTRVRDQEAAIIFLAIGVVFIHALLEFPLHHGYFLLPIGILIGSLNIRLRISSVLKIPRPIFLLSCIGTFALTLVIARDYLIVDASYRTYRLEMARIQGAHEDKMPELLVLNNFSEFLRLLREPVTEEMAESAMLKRENVTYAFPTPLNFFNIIKMYALNNDPIMARHWIILLEKTSSPTDFDNLKKFWFEEAAQSPKMASISWQRP